MIISLVLEGPETPPDRKASQAGASSLRGVSIRLILARGADGDRGVDFPARSGRFEPRAERPAVTSSRQSAGRKLYLSVARCAARRDFLRLARARWMTPDFTPLSKAELTSRYDCIASSFLPLFTASV